MPSLIDLIPDVDVLLALPPEELGWKLLTAAHTSAQNGMFHRSGVTGEQALYGLGFGSAGTPVYPRNRSHQIEEAIGEAWQWLELNMLIMPVPGINGQSGHKTLTRRGREVVTQPTSARAYFAAAAFPKSMLHPQIAEAVWLDLARGDYPTAVFKSFRAVEEAVRQAGGFVREDIGVDLMRRAFNKDNGPLRKADDPIAEREALAGLFAGAIGSYKNPHSHRTVEITDPQEAQEMVTLASHLLRIVDNRRPK